MAKTIFILGAGASKEDGGPLMDEFLDFAHKLKDKPEIKQDYDKVFEAITKLKATHYKSYLDLDNIEEVFGAFEMARLITRLGNYTPQEIEEIGLAINTVIVKTLEDSVKLPQEDRRVYPTPVYQAFAQLINDMRYMNPLLECSILSFNYDVGLDYALNFHGIPIDYCISQHDKSTGMNVLKLHGSLNWGKCECGSIVPWYLSEFFSLRHFETWHEPKYHILNIGSLIGQLQHQNCNKKMTLKPVLVPPTWNKMEYHGELAKVWTQAAIELYQAENVFIIGYSMPESDLFFRYLFALGTASDIKLERLWIFNPDTRGEVQRRADRIVGRGVGRRYRFIKGSFSNAIQEVRRELGVKD